MEETMKNEMMLAERWSDLLKSLTEGAPLEDALQQHRILYREVEHIVLSSPEEALRWREARLLGKASRFSVLDRDEIFSRLARGVPPESAIAEVRGPEGAEQDTADLFELIGGSPEWEERFLSAMRVAGLRTVQKLGAVVADSSKDVLVCEKRGRLPNPVPVQRARLQWEHETYFMGKFNPILFGEHAKTQVNVQINHAAVLEEARDRVKVYRQTQAVTVQGAVREQSPKDRPRISREQMAAAREAVFAANANAPLEPAVEPGAQADHLRNVAAATLEESPSAAQGSPDSETPPDVFAWIEE
jgi:hypothetical protein